MAVAGPVIVSEPPGATVNEPEQEYTPEAELVNVTVPTVLQLLAPLVQFVIVNTSVVLDATLPNA